MTADLDDGHTLNADLDECVFDGFELRRLNYCFQFGHTLALRHRGFPVVAFLAVLGKIEALHFVFS